MSHSRNPSHRCTVCRHDERSRIEYLMAAGVSKRSIAERFGVSADAAWRHWTHHVGPHMKAALVTKSLKPGVELAALVEQEGLGLLEHLQNIRGKLYTVFDAAIEAGDRNAVTGLGRELRENLTPRRQTSWPPRRARSNEYPKRHSQPVLPRFAGEPDTRPRAIPRGRAGRQRGATWRGDRS